MMLLIPPLVVSGGSVWNDPCKSEDEAVVGSTVGGDTTFTA